VLSAQALYERGHGAVVVHGRHTEGARLLQRALGRCGHSDADLRARILITLAYREAERGCLDDGLALLDEALAWRPCPSVRGLVWSQRALLLTRCGDGRAALRAYDHAMPLIDGDPVVRARALLNRGNVHLQHRDLGRARSDFESCAEAASRGGMVRMLGLATQNLGYVELLAGRLPEALRAMDDARPALADSAVDLAALDGDRGQVLLAAGLTSEAETTLARVAQTFGRLGLRQGQAETELALARLHLSVRDHAAARTVARRAATRFRRRGSRSWALLADATVLAARVEGGCETPTVLRTGAELAATLRAERLSDEARVVRLHLSRAMLRTGREADARRLAGTVRTPSTAPITTRLLDRSVRADLAAARGRRSDAAEHLRRGLAELFSWQSSFGSLDLQTGVAAHGRALAIRGLQAAVADGRPTVVFDWSERARAFASRLPPVRPPADERAAAALEALRALRAQAGAAEGAADGSAAAGRHRMRHLEQQVRERALYPAGPGIVNEPLVLGDLQARLAADSGTLVSHLVVDGAVHAVVATPSTAEVHRLGPFAPVRDLMSRVIADLEVAATRLPPPLRAAVAGSLRDGCAALDRLLLGPVRRTDGPVLLVPSAALSAIPWTLLPTLAGRPMALARTATSWALTRTRGDVPHRIGLVAGPAVPRADEEVRSAAAVWPSAELLRAGAADASTVTALASRVDLLHVAAHGTHSADNPLFSGLELTDGPWFGYDIATVDPVPAHVVLSACELGRSSVRSGEETLGMTAAWQHAGARTVVASSVRVNDDTACEVFTAYHERLARGDRPAMALADASGAVAAGSAPAPLICFGAGW